MTILMELIQPDAKFVIGCLQMLGQPGLYIDGYQNNWTGTYKGDFLPDGVYYYTLRVGNREFVGNVTLMR